MTLRVLCSSKVSLTLLFDYTNIPFNAPARPMRNSQRAAISHLLLSSRKQCPHSSSYRQLICQPFLSSKLKYPRCLMRPLALSLLQHTSPLHPPVSQHPDCHMEFVLSHLFHTAPSEQVCGIFLGSLVPTTTKILINFSWRGIGRLNKPFRGRVASIFHHEWGKSICACLRSPINTIVKMYTQLFHLECIVKMETKQNQGSG